MFLSRNKKNNVYPCKPQLYYIKVGFKGVKTIKACFRDVSNRKANSVDPDETAHYEPSHLDLHCLKRFVYLSAGMRELNKNKEINQNRQSTGVLPVMLCIMKRGVPVVESFNFTTASVGIGCAIIASVNICSGSSAVFSANT